MRNISELDTNSFVVVEASSDKSLGELLVEIKGLNKGSNVIQIFNQKAVSSRRHVAGAYINAVASFRNHINKAKSIDLEMLLFAAFTNQINDAIKIAGAKSNSRFVIFSNNKNAFNKIKKSIRNIKELKNGSRESDQKILQKMAMLKLES